MVSFLKKAVLYLISCVIVLTAVSCGKDEKNVDYVTGNKWQSSSEMLLDFDKDGSFKWYSNKSKRNDNYYSGNYTLRYGQAAIEYLRDEQSIDEEAQRSAMETFSVEENCYYAIVMTNKECIQNGENTLKEESEVVYYGYYQPDYEKLTLYNISNMQSYEFTKM